MLPVHYQTMVARNIQTIRRRMAAEFGCGEDEMALTRGASESLQIVQMGLDMEPGDEVVTTEQDYGRMLTTWDQRVRRDKIKVTRLQFPVPTTQDDLYQRFEKAITPRTKVFHFCHITNLSAQLFPVQTAIASGAVERHHYDRGRRARAGTVSVQAPGARVRRLRREPAQVAAGTNRQRVPLCPARDDSEVLAAAGGARSTDERHPQIRGDWHPPLAPSRGTRRSAGVPSGHRWRT